MTRVYRFDPNPVNTHGLLIAAIPQRSRVLEIGTASGYIGEYLIHEKKCEVWGVEPVQELCVDAKTVGYTKLFCTSVEDFLQVEAVKGEKFDVVLMGDVLEHMVHPDFVLSEIKKFIKPNGIAVISLPNVGHYSARKKILAGNWDMSDTGIFDRTHLKFFTLKTMKAMLESSGWQVVSTRPSDGYLEQKWHGLGKHLLFHFPTLFAVQFVFIAQPK
jgi:2-polyprenyl-3-methyl-5-hydroxy-6-metoxy-1,4-benzoquinol methylase